MKLIIYSESECGFWNNEMGWVDRAGFATQFTKEEASSVSKPAAKKSDAIWIEYNERLLFDEDSEDLRMELTDEEAVEAAREKHHRDGECEVDADAKTSRGDSRGCYVQAWVWVYWPEVEVKEIDVK